jgi:hypothetical protein
MPLRIYHPNGDKTDVDGRRYFEDYRVYRPSGNDLPAAYEGATMYVFDEETATTEGGVFGEYERDGAWGFHTGARIWAEAPTYLKLWGLLQLMGDRVAARRYRYEHNGPGGKQHRDHPSHREGKPHAGLPVRKEPPARPTANGRHTSNGATVATAPVSAKALPPAAIIKSMAGAGTRSPD